MRAPWNERPDLARGSIGWRMGSGEDYYNKYYQWFSALSPSDRDVYRNANPEPADWIGFYQGIIDRPWLT
jgi:hypothetical protein